MTQSCVLRIKFNSNLVYLFVSAYVNKDFVYFDTNNRNGLIYILTETKVENNKMFNSKNWIPSYSFNI